MNARSAKFISRLIRKWQLTTTPKRVLVVKKWQTAYFPASQRTLKEPDFTRLTIKIEESNMDVGYLRIQLDSDVIDRQLKIAKMLEYMQLKISEKDWHGVADAAMDIRDLESEILGLKRVLDYVDGAK